MSKHKTNEEFIKRAKLVHSDKYNYSKVNYIDSKTKVIIIDEYGFEHLQTPNNHLNGCRLSIKTVLDKSGYFKMFATIKHKNVYDYSKVNYINTNTEITIICKKHGEFQQKAGCHLYGRNCPECSKYSKDDFIKKARMVHGDKYDYSKVKYVGYFIPVTIICKIHGEFRQKPNIHLGGTVCPKCSKLQPKSYDECYNEALKYETKKDFSQNAPKHYAKALRKKWIDKICTHMHPLSNIKKRCIYVYEFNINGDLYAYVGLTYNLNQRNNTHHSKGKYLKSSVYDFCKKNEIVNYKPKQLTDYISIEKAAKLESYYIELYRKNGYILLNKINGGGLGGNPCKYDYNYCKNIALKYDNKCDFNQQNDSIYRYAKKNGFYDKITSHMIVKHPKYSKDDVIKEALKFKSYQEFRIHSKNMYSYAARHKLLDDIAIHIQRDSKKQKPKMYYTKDICIELASKCINRTQFNIDYYTAYEYSRQNGWLDEIYPIINLYTKENCFNLASTCYSRTNFQNRYSTAYKYSNRNGWLDEFFPKK